MNITSEFELSQLGLNCIELKDIKCNNCAKQLHL